MSKRKQVRLLVVDEQTEFCELLEEIAELASNQFDIKCEFTDCGDRASELVRKWEPSVILVDADISGVDSKELVRSFRQVRVPVVVTSQVQSRTIEESARRWGASGYVAKSSDHSEMERLVIELATLSTAERYLH
ncbi:MAG: response regulator [Proteobacteria bacterium]|nr:response regulator [Pseudomonadota bacterium]